MAVPADLIPRDAAIIDRRFIQIPGIVSAAEDAGGFVFWVEVGADVGLVIVAFDVTVPAACDFSLIFVGQEGTICSSSSFSLIFL